MSVLFVVKTTTTTTINKNCSSGTDSSFIQKLTMASSENSNLVTEFEQAFAEAFGTLCEDDPLADKTTHEEQKIVINIGGAKGRVVLLRLSGDI